MTVCNHYVADAFLCGMIGRDVAAADTDLYAILCPSRRIRHVDGYLGSNTSYSSSLILLENKY